MPLVLSIDSESAELELPDTTVTDYKFDYSQPNDNVAKGYAERIGLIVTIDVKEILSLKGSFEDNLRLVQDLRDWAEYVVCTNSDSYEKYYRKVTLKNYFGEEQVRLLELSHAYVNKSTESYEPLKGKHTIILELLQRGDKHSYVKG
jgi:hypothetical protein